MPVKKMGTRREWSSSDERELKALVRQKTPARLIARRLKRTEGAVRQKLFQMGISLRPSDECRYDRSERPHGARRPTGTPPSSELSIAARTLA